MTETAIDTELTDLCTFEEARERYQSAIFAYVSRRVRPIDDAEDVVAYTFADAYIHWGKLRHDAKTWLFGIARRKVADALRRNRPWWRIAEGDKRGNSMDEFVLSSEAADAMRIVDGLSADQREALLLQVLEGFSIVEIAQIMGRNSMAINSLLQRARANVQRAVEAASGESK